jgi:MFS family permease
VSSPRLLTLEFGIVAASAALYNGGFGALNVLLPPYVVDVLGGTETTAGIVMGAMAATALVGRPWVGRIADRHGARRIIVLGALTGALGITLLLLGDDLALTLAARLVMGLGNAGVFTGSTLLAMTLAPSTRRAEAAAYILVSVHLGVGLGPIAGEAIRNSMSYDAAWILVIAMMLAAAGCATALSYRPGHPDAVPAPLVNRAAVGPGIVSLLGVFTFNGLLTFTPLYAREIGLDDAALVFTTASMTIVVMRLAFGTVPDRIGPVRAATFALVVTAMGAGVVAFWNEPIGLYVGAALTAVGLSLQSPSFMSIAVGRVPDSQRGSAMATYTGFFDVANALVGPTVGIIVSVADYRTAFAFTGALSLVALLLLLTNVAPRERGDVPWVSFEMIRIR